MSSSNLPLEGIRVIDVGTLIAGPFAATLLGDFGAEVIKVEQPGSGDTHRSLGPAVDGQRLDWAVTSRNKRSITLDLRQPEGQELLLRLAAVSDVLVENFRPGTLEGWNLGPERLETANPRLVVCRVSGFGQTGPDARKPGFDRIGLAFGGLMYLTGYPDRPPVRATIPVGDYICASYAALGVLLALYERDGRGSGRGQAIDVAMYETIFRLTESVVATYELTGRLPERLGNRNVRAAPTGVFATRDGRYVAVAIVGEPLWQRFTQALAGAPLADDPRFATNADRMANVETLEALVAEWIGDRDYAEVARTCDEHAVPVSLIYSAADIATDPHYAARESIAEVSWAGKILRMPAVVPRLGRTPGRIDHAGPTLGEHNEPVYGGLLGLRAADLEALRANRVI